MKRRDDKFSKRISQIAQHAIDESVAEVGKFMDGLHFVAAAPDETGWLVEENAGGPVHWIALSKDAWPRTKENRFSRRFGFEDYLSPVVRVKDANEALRFSRKQDAEAFIQLFSRFLLAPTATEHEWPASQGPTGNERGAR